MTPIDMAGSAWSFKRDRASEHIKTLKSEIDEYGKTTDHAVTMVIGFDLNLKAAFPQTVNGRVTVTELPDISRDVLRWGTLIGDVAHNLRCVLDYLAYDMVAYDNGGIGWKDTQFPIVDDPRFLKSNRRFKGTMERLKLDRRKVVERHQPYSTEDGSLGKHFAFLRDLSDEDKHRTVRPTLYAPRDFFLSPVRMEGVEVHDATSFIRQPLAVGTELLTMTATFDSPDSKMEVEPHFEPYVAFSDGWGVIDRLKALEIAVGAFMGEFLLIVRR